jgi:hypothetical protein
MKAASVESLEMLEEISERARAQGSGLVLYPVDDVEAVCSELRASLRRGSFALVPQGGAA